MSQSIWQKLCPPYFHFSHWVEKRCDIEQLWNCGFVGRWGGNCENIKKCCLFVTCYPSCTPYWADKLLNRIPEIKLGMCMLWQIGIWQKFCRLEVWVMFGDKWCLKPCGMDQDEEIKLGTEDCRLKNEASLIHILPKSPSTQKLIIKQGRNCTISCTLSLKWKKQSINATLLNRHPLPRPSLETGMPGVLGKSECKNQVTSLFFCLHWKQQYVCSPILANEDEAKTQKGKHPWGHTLPRFLFSLLTQTDTEGS